MRKLFAALAIAAAATASFTFVRAEEPAKKADQMPRCPIDPKAGAALERIKALTGTWTAAGEAGAPEMKVVFHPTAGGSAVMETMFPGSDHEMVNLFTANGSTIFMTHYCVENEQPHMKLTSGDEATMKRCNASLRQRGILKGENKYYISLAHTEEDVAFTLDAFAGAIGELQGGRAA